MRDTGPVVPLYDGILFVHGTTPDQVTDRAQAYLVGQADADEDGWRVIDGPVKVGPHHLETSDEGAQYVPGPGPEGTGTVTGAVVDTILVNEDTITFRPDGTAYRKYARPVDDVVRAAQQIVALEQKTVVLEEVRAYVASVGPIDPANAGQLVGHLMQAEVLLGKVAAAFTEPRS